jgi:epidermal growth factor receptor substrate 15
MKYLVVVLMLLFGTEAWSQSLKFLFRGRIENIDLGKNEGGVTVSIVQGGSSVSSVTSSSNGKYTLRGTVNYTQPFDVVFSKSGLVSKKVTFDFSTLNEEDTPAASEFEPVESLDMTLFKERDNVDFSFLDTEPVAAFDWNARRMAPRLDGAQVNKMKAKIEALLNKEEQIDADYQAAIQAGDAAFGEKDYESALASFEKAVGLKPNEQYPNDKILELDALIQAQKDAELAEKQANQEYYNLIEAGDNLRDAGDIRKAISKYKEASAMKSDEQYPKDQIATLEAQIEAEEQAAANEEAYKAAIKSGDVFMRQNSLRPAKDKFEEAAKLKPEEAYPKEKLKEIEEKMAALEEQEALKKKYKEAIAAADASYDAEEYQVAKDKYNEALTYESSSTYAKGRIEMCDEALAASKAEEERLAKIQELLAQGNADLGASKYEDAVTSFSEVLKLDAENAEATTKLAEAQAKLEELANEAERDRQYTELITQGDDANAANNLEDALSKYQAAKALKDTPEVNEKISAVQDAINLAKAEADKEEKYTALIAEAEAKFGSDDLQGAIDKYTEATTVDPTKTEPAEKIAEIQAMLDERAADQAKSEQFATLMKEGNDLLAANDLENAKAKFQEAQTVDSSSPEPQAKIDEIDALIAQNAAEQEKLEQFNALMKEGNDLIASNDLENAKSKFQEAQTVDASRPEPQQKIDEIDALIAKQLEDQANKEKQEQLLAAKDAADKAFDASDWDEAESKYNEMLGIDPANQHATVRIAEIGDKRAQEELNAQITALLDEGKSLRDDSNLEDARSKFQEVIALDPSNSVATAQIDEINAELAAAQNEAQKEQAFADLTAEAEVLFNDDKLLESKQKYTEALAYKDDAGVKQKITDIEALIAEREAQAELDRQKAEQEAQQAAIDAEYDAFIQQAEANEASENYAAAVADYQKASGVKPNEDLPKQKIKELNDLMAEIQAASSVNEQYANFISEAEGFENSGNLQAAISSYQKAKDVKPEETLPDTKIAELNALIAENAAQQAKIEKDYADAMERGENLMKDENYLDAITAFNEALALKPTEKLPKERAAAAEEAERKRGDGDAQYEKILTVAESKIESGDYDKAEELIGRAKMFKPNDTRPDKLLEQVSLLRQRDKKYDDLIASAESEAGKQNYKKAISQFEKAKTVKPSESFPDERIAALNKLLENASSAKQKEALYLSYMDKGNSAVAANKFVEALGHYQNALSVKPGDQVAQDKVNEIQQILDDLANADKEKLEKKQQFDALIKEGDKLFAEERYMDAKAQYDAALGVDPFSSFAKEKSDECVRMAKMVADRDKEAQYQKLLGKADESFENEDWDKAKDYYNRAMNVRKSDPYPKKKLEEIELILNPPVAESVELQPLGEVFNGSITDGSTVIQASEDEKALSKGIKIQQELSKADASQADISAQNQDERLDTQNEIYAIWEKVAVSTEGADDSREATVEELREAERIRSDKNIQDLAFEKGDNLSAQERLNIATEESILDYLQDKDDQFASREKVKGIQVAEAEETYRQGGAYIQRKYEADEKLNQVAIKVEEDVRNDYEELLEVDRIVDNAEDETSEIYKTIGESKYENLQREKAGINRVTELQTTKAEEGKLSVKENNEKVKDIQEDVSTVALAYMQQNDENGKEVDAEIAEVKRKVIADNDGFDKVRKEANDRIKGIQTDQIEQSEEEFEGQRDKYLANAEELTEEERKRGQINEKAKVAMDDKIAYVNEKDRQARSKSSQGELSDTDQRLTARQKIVNQEIAKSNKSTEDVESHVENTENLKDVKKASETKAETEALVKREKSLDAQQKLDKIDGSQKEKVKIANSLGEEYPEGVTQEMFSRKDEAGLITTVITRRIVVIDGHADVYVRTETKNGITYSKNGKPSLSHVWNSETQGPDLERHY